MISTNQIHSITENVFTTMLGCPVTLASDMADLEQHAPITGCVQISGTWFGAVMVQTTQQLATHAASTMLAMEETDVQKIDRQDTMAEIANMVGGNIKSLVPSPSVLSLPTVTSGEDFDIRIFGTRIEKSVDMLCRGQQLRIVLCAEES